MGLKYNRMTFGKKRNRITFVHLNKPWKLGLAGMVTTPLFEEKIAVVIDDTPIEESDYDYACISCDKNGRAPRIMMHSRVFYDIKRGYPEARTILLHELGHYRNRDIPNESGTIRDDREALAASGQVSQAELRADAFAVQYLGAETVAAGLSALKERILSDYSDREAECYSATIKEIDLRIAAVVGSKNYIGGSL